jgi:hypothetical protein
MPSEQRRIRSPTIPSTIAPSPVLGTRIAAKLPPPRYPRYWMVSLGIRPIGVSDRPDLGTRCTQVTAMAPYNTGANGPPMARGLIALGTGQTPIHLGPASSLRTYAVVS